jgi:hypothetical protein
VFPFARGCGMRPSRAGGASVSSAPVSWFSKEGPSYRKVA